MEYLLKPHQHENLPSQTSFRVAEILRGQDGDPISCLLHAADLSDPVEYEVISYAWNDARNRATVICDGKTLDVTRSLHEALAHFRLQDRSRFLWVDGVW